MIEKIKAEELLFSGEIKDNMTNTCLELNDYEWMYYELATRFRTKGLGKLDVVFRYYGLISSEMEVMQTLNEETTKYLYVYDTDIFIKYIKRFLQKHMESWDDKFTFNGEDIVIDFYNEVIEKGKLCEE